MVRKQDGPEQGDNPDSSGLVPVIFVANTKEAGFYQTLLADADIPAFIDPDADGRSSRPDKGIAVLVSTEMLDEASDIITAREELDAHILSSPEEGEFDDDVDDELTGPSLDDDTVEDEDIFFRTDPFADEDDVI
ncbi:MAG: hypothetical protein GWP14_09165 [Actinobacteria bacterium]|nr:hypothetical protein [Actinomycetota bacterium]